MERHRQSLIAEQSLLCTHRAVSSTVLITTVNTYVFVKREICQRDQRYWAYDLRARRRARTKPAAACDADRAPAHHQALREDPRR